MGAKLIIRGERSRFFIRRVQDAINRRAMHNVRRAAEELLDDTRRNITAANSPPASVPGEYPHRQTGDLAASGKINVDKEIDGIFATVAFTAGHAAYVEKARPFLSRTAEEGRARYRRTLLQRIFGAFRGWGGG